MKNAMKLATFLVLLVTFAAGQPASNVVISEVSAMWGVSAAFNTGEFIELYNPFSVDITFGSSVQIISGNTSGTNAAEWQVSLSGKIIKAYGFLLIGDGGVPTKDVVFPASKNLANSGVRSCVQLRDGNVVIDAFAWDASTTLLGEGTKFTPSNTTSNGKSWERKSGSLATAPDLLGNAWDSNNNASDFFENNSTNANPQYSGSPIEVNSYGLEPPGSGRASVTPARFEYKTATTVQFIFKPQVDILRSFRFTKPATFIWNSSNITLHPNTVSITQSGDTTILTNFAIGGTDSIVATITNVTTVDTTDEFTFDIRASKDGIEFAPISIQQKILVYGSPRPMSVVKRKETNGVHSLIGKWAVVEGVVTAANEFSSPTYLQDETAGIAVYDSSVSNNVERGDKVILLGKVAPFYEMFELVPCSILEKVSEGNSFDTLTLTIAQIKSQPVNGIEQYECRLVRINDITSIGTIAGQPSTPWTTIGSGSNYKIFTGAADLEIRITSKTNLANTTAPNPPFDVVGVLGQFLTNYQILPRSYDDIIVEGQGPRIAITPPYESNITSNSITLRWQTDVLGSSILQYGTTLSYGKDTTEATLKTQHEIVLTNLTHATIYNIKLGSQNSNGTSFTANYILSTASEGSSGQINVFFNKSVNTTYARGENAQITNLASRIISRIEAAAYSIDASIYSLSGTIGANIASALIAAKDRGVKVRVIGEKDNQGTTPWSTLKNNGITVIDDGYDALNAGAGLMHNKFYVFDNRDATSDTDDWVITGSWNATDPGTNNDAQNIIEIQDKALANAFTVEFNEMWGSSTETPVASASRFGARKYDNTPHVFNINGTPVELYFSPSDRTTSKIIKTVNEATSSFNLAMLTFTRTDIANALIAKHNAGIKVKVLMDNRTDQGSVFDVLQTNGIDIFLKGAIGGMLHHKYAIVNADGTAPNQYVITGSHNWSSNAENSNSENTLILKSPRIANLYLQEFAARYIEAGGTGQLVSVQEQSVGIPTSFCVSQNYPNPFNPSTTIEYQIPPSPFSEKGERGGFVSLKVFDILGRHVATLVNEAKRAGVYKVTWDASSFPSGVYFYQVNAGNFVAVKKALLVK